MIYHFIPNKSTFSWRLERQIARHRVHKFWEIASSSGQPSSISHPQLGRTITNKINYSSCRIMTNCGSGLGHHELRARLAVVGDVHDHWGEEDELALEYLDPDAVVFVGDLGNENVSLVEEIAKSTRDKIFILGNHDAWYSLTTRGRNRAIKMALSSSSLSNFTSNVDRIQESLDLLGTRHVGYSSLPMKELGLAFVGGRPFSKGGAEWVQVADFYDKYYGIKSFEDSTNKILEHLLHPGNDGLGKVVVAHNGPAGLGCKQEDPCGIDFMEPADDFGDPDLEEALEICNGCNNPASLVLFGHMHHTLKKGGFRNMVDIHEISGTVYLNAAVVPRVKTIKKHKREGLDSAHRARHFLMVEMVDGVVWEAKNVWVSVEHGKLPGTAEVVDEQIIFKRALSEDGNSTVVNYYKAHTDSWDVKVIMNGQETIH